MIGSILKASGSATISDNNLSSVLRIYIFCVRHRKILPFVRNLTISQIWSKTKSSYDEHLLIKVLPTSKHLANIKGNKNLLVSSSRRIRTSFDLDKSYLIHLCLIIGLDYKQNNLFWFLFHCAEKQSEQNPSRSVPMKMSWFITGILGAVTDSQWLVHPSHNLVCTNTSLNTLFLA